MVEFRTKLDEKAVASLANFQLKKSVWIFVVLSALFILAGVLFIVLADSFFDEYGFISTDVLIGIILIVFGVILFPIFLYAIKNTQKKMNKSMSILSEETESVFTFDENEITVSQKKGDEYEAFTRAKYNYLFKVEETPTHYFLYISKAQCHVIDKASITQGSLTELNAHLINNLRQKFKPMRNK